VKPEKVNILNKTKNNLKIVTVVLFVVKVVLDHVYIYIYIYCIFIYRNVKPKCYVMSE